jgi:hypothetical protein
MYEKVRSKNSQRKKGRDLAWTARGRTRLGWTRMPDLRMSIESGCWMVVVEMQ